MEPKNVPPPQYGLYPAVPALTSPNPNMSVPVGPNSCQLTCPSCHARISTRCDKSSTTKTHLFALLLCLCLCWPCVCLPYCMDSCKTVNHYCPSCNAFLGTYNH